MSYKRCSRLTSGVRCKFKVYAKGECRRHYTQTRRRQAAGDQGTEALMDQYRLPETAIEVMLDVPWCEAVGCDHVGRYFDPTLERKDTSRLLCRKHFIEDVQNTSNDDVVSPVVLERLEELRASMNE